MHNGIGNSKKTGGAVMKLIFRKHNFILWSIILSVGFSLYVLSGLKHVYAEEQDKPCPIPYIDTLLPRAAKPGEEIKIRGNRFGKKQGSVTFSPGVKSPILKWTNKRIWVTVPMNSKTGLVFVSSSCGEISNEVYFTIKSEGE